ncbi:unnamed protein product [Rotaria magnacalcarata]|uniref:Uncharacterized protein n=1 Tax=Rotaria magnacalcarata TaxID=392030 RepID=A0A816WYD6_9BILA|nr:unnamed protein product [Rotaria magnacalcarata]
MAKDWWSIIHSIKTSRCHVVTRDQLSFTKKDNLKTGTSALFNAADDPSHRFKGIVLSSGTKQQCEKKPDENASDSSNELIIAESEGKGTDDNNDDEESEDETEALTCATISQQRGNTITASNKSRVSAIQSTSNTPAASALPATTVSSDAAVLQEINCNVDVTHKRKEPSGETHNVTNKTKRSIGVSHSDYEKLKRENKRLAKEIDMYKNNWMRRSLIVLLRYQISFFPARPSGPTASYFIDVGKILSGFSNVETGEEDACKKLEDITLILKMSDTALKSCERDTDITKTCRQIVKYIYRDPQIRSRMLVSTMDVDILKAIQDYARMIHPLQAKTHNSVLNNAVGNVFATEKRKIERHETGEEASIEMDDSVEDT